MGKILTDQYVSVIYCGSAIRQNSLFILKTPSIIDITKVTKNLKNTKAIGYDNIPVSIIKQNSEYIIPCIREIINESFTSGTVSANIKISKITPIHKTGDKKDYNNYRPISILPVFDKIITKIVNNQLMEYLSKNDIINSRQYGFRPNSNTTNALFDIVTVIQSHIPLMVREIS